MRRGLQVHLYSNNPAYLLVLLLHRASIAYLCTKPLRIPGHLIEGPRNCAVIR